MNGKVALNGERRSESDRGDHRLRVGVWNLKLAPDPTRTRGQEMLALARDCDADIWLFTEVHVDWHLRGYVTAISSLRSAGPERKRWSGIACRETFDLTPLAAPGSSPADEGLCMARLRPRGLDGPSLLVACSVLPWTGTVNGWPSLHEPGQFDGFADRFQYVTRSHLDRIRRERQASETLIWGGDFNESLSGPAIFSKAGRTELLEAFRFLHATALTANVRHLLEGRSSIDHLAVSSDWYESSQVTVVTRSGDVRQTSDHALYLIDVTLKPADVPW